MSLIEYDVCYAEKLYQWKVDKWMCKMFALVMSIERNEFLFLEKYNTTGAKNPSI